MKLTEFFLKESTDKTAVVGIGNFVGHIGHQQLADQVIDTAREVGGTPYIFVGNAVGKDDPLPVEMKLHTWHALYPKLGDNVSAVQQGGTPFKKIEKELINPQPGHPPRYNKIIIMTGKDMESSVNAWIEHEKKRLGGFAGYENVQLQGIATERDEAAGGTGMSFTKCRDVLKDPNMSEEQQLQFWLKAFDPKLGKDYIKKMMDTAREQMAKFGVKIPQRQKDMAPAETMAGVGMQDSPERNATGFEEGKETARDKWKKASYQREKDHNDFMNKIKDKPHSEKMSAMMNKIQQNLNTKEAKVDEKIKGVDGKSCWDGYRYAGKEKKANGKYKDKCVKIGEGWEAEMAEAVTALIENFANGVVKGKSRPGRVKRAGASCKGSVTSLRAKAKNASGEKEKMYRWCANMKSGHKKKK